MVNRPAGLLSPKSVSAMAVPPNSPGYHASRIAGTCSLAQPMVSGLPFSSTNTVGLPAGHHGFEQRFLIARQIEI